MSSRRTGNGEEEVYAAAEAWVERALRADDSLFTPGEAIWSGRWLRELRERFLDRPDESGDDFYEKLERQLAGSPSEVYQLMGEALFAHFLIVSQSAMRGDTKTDRINWVLGKSPEPSSIPAHFTSSLSQGIAHPGTFFLVRHDVQLGFISELVEQLKEKETGEHELLLNDCWEFKTFTENIDFRSVTLRGSSPATVRAQRDALLHLIFPDTFEGIVSADHKNRIASAFEQYVTVSTDDVDRKLRQIHARLDENYGRSINFYDSDIRPQWDDKYKPGLWNEFVRRAKLYVSSGKLEIEENRYKREMAESLAVARAAVLDDDSNWPDLLKHALRGREGHPIAWQLLSDFNQWYSEHPDQARRALQVLWEESSISVAERIRAFTNILPASALRGAEGNRANVISVLLMGLDVEQYPPFRVGKYNEAYYRTGYSRPDAGVDEAALYEHSLTFLDRLIEEASERDLQIEHHLDAQGIVWGVLYYGDGLPDEGEKETENEFNLPIDLAALAGKLHLPAGFLEEINILLEDKKQVIFQGPPGTGKTYVAQALAEHIAGSKDRVTLVQFHPSYDYVDFVQGYRPALMENGQPGFRLLDGPLLRAAKQAEAERDGQAFPDHR